MDFVSGGRGVTSLDFVSGRRGVTSFDFVAGGREASNPDSVFEGRGEIISDSAFGGQRVKISEDSSRGGIFSERRNFQIPPVSGASLEERIIFSVRYYLEGGSVLITKFSSNRLRLIFSRQLALIHFVRYFHVCFVWQ